MRFKAEERRNSGAISNDDNAEARQLCPFGRVRITLFSLPSHMVEKLDSIAYNNNLSLNALIVQCLKYALSQMNENTSE